MMMRTLAVLSILAGFSAAAAASSDPWWRRNSMHGHPSGCVRKHRPVVRSVLPGEIIRPRELNAEPDVTLRVGIVNDPPFVIVDPESGALSGINIQLFHSLVEELSVDPTLNTTYEAELTVFSSYQNALAAVFNHSIDITGFALDATLAPMVTFSVPFYVMQFVMTTLERQDTAHTWVVLQPFTLGTWALVGLFVLSMGFLFFFVDACSPVGSRGREGMFCPAFCVGSFGRRVRRRQLALAQAASAKAGSSESVAAGALTPSAAKALAEEAADAADASLGVLRGGGTAPVGAPVVIADGVHSDSDSAAAEGSSGHHHGASASGHATGQSAQHGADGAATDHQDAHAAKPLGLWSTLFDTLVFSLGACA